jgi:hypothetical protein
MPTVVGRLSSGARAPLCAVVVAAWVATLRGPQAARLGVADAAADRWLTRLDAGTGSVRGEVEALLGMPGFVLGDAPGAAEFADEVVAVAERLWAGDVHRVLSEALAERSRS